MKTLASRERLSLEQNKDLQWRDLLRLLAHAESTSPFYRRRFAEAGIRVAQIQSPADLEKIPPLTRNDLRAHLEDIRSRRFTAEQLHSAATGGTTDTPIPLFRDGDSLMWKAAVQWRFNAWAGMHPGDKVFYLWGARQDYDENPSWRWRLYDRHLMRRVWAPTSLFNAKVFENYRETLNAFRPEIVYAYPTPLALFCEYLRDCKRAFHHPRAVICTAELLLSNQRQIIEETLQCDVFEHYGTRDFGMIAGQCNSHKQLHLNPTAAYVEHRPVRREQSEGLTELLVTDLLNYGMPLIRYQINDCTLEGPEKCGCGLGFPLLQTIVGRTMDNFFLSNGDVVPGISFQNRVLKTCPGLLKTQFIQESPDHFRIRFVPGQTFSESDLDLLRSNLRRFLPENVRYTFEQVVDIPREASGKTRFCISHVNASPVEEIAAHQH